MTTPSGSEAPGGLSRAEFKSVSLDVGDWLWGMVQGSFNEKQLMSQMIVDAVIGMIPLVGDVTAARDLIAIVIGLCDDPRKREDKMQWMLLVIMIFALIPVFGGVIKGVGRILVHTMGEIARVMEKSARAARLLELARDLVATANRLGIGNAEKWLKELNFARYQDALMGHINELLVRLHTLLGKVERKLSWVVPASLKDRITALKEGIIRVQALIAGRIPNAIKQLDSHLREVQAFIHSGGETTSKAVSHTAQAGAKNVSYTQELIALEGKGATRSARGGFVQNATSGAEAQRLYKYEPGYPDLKSYSVPIRGGGKEYPRLGTFSGQIVNREMEVGETFFRAFGPEGATHGAKVDESFAAGSPRRLGEPSFWGLGEVPAKASEWRQGSAVLDEWNRNGFVIIGRVLPDRPTPLRACTGLIAEQQGKKIGVQYLKGGGKQAMMEIPADVAVVLNDLGKKAQTTNKSIKQELWGVVWEIHPTI